MIYNNFSKVKMHTNMSETLHAIQHSDMQQVEIRDFSPIVNPSKILQNNFSPKVVRKLSCKPET